MAASPSSPPQERAEPLSVPPPPPSNPPSAASRRLPPPCWSHDETVALIDSYREKWYSLRRGNLKATHWQEVADSVAARCPVASPPKTSVQCRHKMEKLRKRYRNELQRSLAATNRTHRSSPSAWVHFARMHSMEKGPSAAVAAPSPVAADSNSDAPEEEEDDDFNNDDDDDDLYGNGSAKPHGYHPYNRSVNSVMGNGVDGSRSAFRIKFPGGSSGLPPPVTGFRSRNHENPNPNFGARAVREIPETRGSGAPGKKRERETGAIAEMVEAVKVLGDGFVRMEKLKMEMAKEIEVMRMEMEMKRTEMILESQQRIVEAFAKGFAEKKKKAKRTASPES